MKQLLFILLSSVIALLTFFDVSAQREWSKHIDFQGRNASEARLTILADSSIVLATERLNSNTDIVVIKVNVHGDTLWSKTIDEGADEYIGDVIADQNTVYIVGSQVAQNNAFLLYHLDANGDSLDSRRVGLPAALGIKDAYLSQNRIVAAGEAFIATGRQPAVVTYDLVSRAFQNAAVTANGGDGQFNGIAPGDNKEMVAVGHIDNDSAIVCRLDSSLQLISTSMVGQLIGSIRGIANKTNGYMALLAADSNTRSNTNSYVMHLDTGLGITNVDMHEGLGNLNANTIVNFNNQGYVIGGNLDSGQFTSPFIAFFFQQGDTLTKMMNNKVRGSTPTVLNMAYNHEFVAAVGNASLQSGQREGYSLFVKDSIPGSLCNPGIQKYWKASTNVNIRLIGVNASPLSSFVFPTAANPRISNLSLTLDTSVCLLSGSTPTFNPLTDTTSLCGDSVTLNAAAFGIQSYSWSSGSNTNEEVAKQTGTYVVTGTDPQGNTYVDSTYVRLLNKPSLLLEAKPNAICAGDTVQLSTTLTTHATGQWKNSSSILNPMAQNTKSAPVNSEWFVFTATDSITGCSQTDSVEVLVNSIPSPPFELNGVARKKNGKPLNASQVYLLTYKNNQEKVIDTFKTSFDGKFSFTHSETTVYLKVEPNIRLYQGQMVTYYKSAESIDSAQAITYTGCESKIGVGFRTLKGQNITSISEVSQSELHLKVVPNPSNGVFRIEGSKPLNGTIYIQSVHGQTIFEVTVKDEELLEVNLKQNSGIYFVHYLNAEGASTFTPIIID